MTDRSDIDPVSLESINKNLVPTITGLDDDNLKKLVRAIQSGTLAMTATRRKGTLEPAILLCEVGHDLRTDTTTLTPLAELLKPGAYEGFYSPFEDIAQSAIN